MNLFEMAASAATMQILSSGATLVMSRKGMYGRAAE
jgi:hypothetical protein